MKAPAPMQRQAARALCLLGAVMCAACSRATLSRTVYASLQQRECQQQGVRAECATAASTFDDYTQQRARSLDP